MQYIQALWLLKNSNLLTRVDQFSEYFIASEKIDPPYYFSALFDNRKLWNQFRKLLAKETACLIVYARGTLV